MKVVVGRNNLKEGLTAVERAAGAQQNLPVLKNVLLETEQNKLILTATNLEIAISFFVQGKVIENGKAALPLGVFSDIVANIPSERLNLENKKTVSEITADNYRAAVNGTAADEFPIIPKVKRREAYLDIESGFLKDALSQVVIASQFSDLRPELNSIFFDFSIDSLKVVGTDSFRLAEKTLTTAQFRAHNEEPFTFLLPLRSAQELMRILKDEGMVRLCHDENQALFTADHMEFFSRLMEGTFPDYRAVVPQSFSAEITLSRQELLNALKLAGIFSARASEVRVKLLENKKVMEISSADQAVGENSYLVPVKLRGAAKELAFNWRYLSDGLRALAAEEIFFGVNEDNKPALVKTPNDASYFYLIMPILKS